MDFPHGPVVKNVPANTGGRGSGKTPQVAEQLSPCAQLRSLCATTWNCNCGSHVPQPLKPTCPRTCALQQEKPPQLEKAHELQQRPSTAINKQTEGSV